MPRTKELPSKKVKERILETAPERNSEVEALPVKSRVPVEVEDPETALEAEEKPEADGLAGDAEEEALAADEIGIDDEEIDPFGDKWEQ